MVLGMNNNGAEKWSVKRIINYSQGIIKKLYTRDIVLYYYTPRSQSAQ